MNYDSQAAIIANDLDSLVHRIEALQAHPEFTKAMVAVQAARQAVVNGRVDIHQTEIRKRFAAQDAVEESFAERFAREMREGTARLINADGSCTADQTKAQHQ